MTAVTNWLRREPVIAGALLTIAATLAASIPTGQGQLGGVVSALVAVVLGFVRQQVSPVASDAPKAGA